MIAQLTGTLTHKSPVFLIVDVNGVGYQVFSSLTTYYRLPKPGDRVSLRIHTHLREEALKLYGFLQEEELVLFEKLIGISKVGPKLALAILSGMSAQELVAAVMNRDIEKLNGIPGVGRKTAERLTLEMKDKLSDMEIQTAAPQTTSGCSGVVEDALSALINLGYKKPQAEKALASLTRNNGKEMSLESLIKESLTILS